MLLNRAYPKEELDNIEKGSVWSDKLSLRVARKPKVEVGREKDIRYCIQGGHQGRNRLAGLSIETRCRGDFSKVK